MLDRMISIASVTFALMTWTGWTDLGTSLFIGGACGFLYMLLTTDWKEEDDDKHCERSN